MRVLLDTCVVLWAVSEPERLTSNMAEVITRADSEVFVSVISAAELACGVERGRIRLDRHWKPWFRHFVEVNGWRIIPIDLRVMEEAYSLPGEFHQDPADRIVVASARVHDLFVVTDDRRILDYPFVETISRE